MFTAKRMLYMCLRKAVPHKHNNALNTVPNALKDIPRKQTRALRLLMKHVPHQSKSRFLWLAEICSSEKIVRCTFLRKYAPLNKSRVVSFGENLFPRKQIMLYIYI